MGPRPKDPNVGPVYDRMVVLASKTYALRNSIGEVSVVGGASVRRNTPPIQIAYTQTFLTRVLTVDTTAELRLMIIDMTAYLRQLESSIRNVAMPLSQLATRTTRGGMTRFQYMGDMGQMVVLARAKTIDSRFDTPIGTAPAGHRYYTRPCYEFCCSLIRCFGYSDSMIRSNLLSSHGGVRTSLVHHPLPTPSCFRHSG